MNGFTDDTRLAKFTLSADSLGIQRVETMQHLTAVPKQDFLPLKVNEVVVANGTPTKFDEGNYVVSENGQDDYSATFSGDCDANGAVSLSEDDNKTCIITNNDNPAQLKVPRDAPVQAAWLAGFKADIAPLRARLDGEPVAMR